MNSLILSYPLDEQIDMNKRLMSLYKGPVCVSFDAYLSRYMEYNSLEDIPIDYMERKFREYEKLVISNMRKYHWYRTGQHIRLFPVHARSAYKIMIECYHLQASKIRQYTGMAMDKNDVHYVYDEMSYMSLRESMRLEWYFFCEIRKDLYLAVNKYLSSKYLKDTKSALESALER